MKRALLITMYYEPLNLVPVGRMQMMVNGLLNAGYQVDVWTRSYNESDLNSSDLSIARTDCSEYSEDKQDQLTIVRFPFSSENKKLKTSRRLPPGVRGWYNMRNIDVFHYDFLEQVQSYYERHEPKYDQVIVSYGPPIVLAIALYMARQNLSTVVDFRDAFTTELDTPGIRRAKQATLKRLTNAIAGFTYASGGVRDITEGAIGEKTRNDVIWNGVVELTPTVDPATKSIQAHKTDGKVVCVHAGSLYRGQDIEELVEYVDRWATERGQEAVHYLIGLANFIPDVQEQSNVHVLPKLSRESARHALWLADLLLLPVWKDRYTGFSGKLLEYLYSGRPVLCGQNAQEDLKGILSSSPNTYIIKGADDFAWLDHVAANEFQSIDFGKNELTSEYQATRFVAFLESLD